MKAENEDYFYITPAGPVEEQFTVKGSRFIATLAPVSTEKQVKALLSKVAEKYSDATHHTYAYRLGAGAALIERASDDREPAGSAGAPMLQVLQGRNISDVVIVGTRYFGGTKLGIGGLTRAYRDCVRYCLEQARMKKKEQQVQLTLYFPFEQIGVVNRLLNLYEARQVDLKYTEQVKMIIRLPFRQSAPFEEDFQAVCRGQGLYEYN